MASERQAVIVGAARTPIGKFLGTLSPLSAPRLGAVAIREAVRRAGIDPARIDEVIMGNVVSAGLGQAPARQAAIGGGIPDSVSAVTVNKVCGSGLMAVMLAAQAIRAGDGELYVAGGMESMSNGPYLQPEARTGYRMGDGRVIDAVVHDGLWCPFENQHMGISAEWIAERYKLERAELDEYAVQSHRKAVAAIQAGCFRSEIVPVDVRQRKGSQLLEQDELPRADTGIESLARLSPAFKPGGMITAGNSSGLSDGAAAVVVMEESAARDRGLQPLARVLGYASAAIQPLQVFACPPLAIRQMLGKLGLTLADFDLIEINEAFAAQTVANGKELGWDWSKVNVNGGAIALGHPIGASGARILTTLIYALRDRGLKRGLASLCLGGGGAVAMAVEVV
ncbi:MAG: acetyl-CoA C-acetyltransferase [Chloroflexota bacterium]|nr:MAG: acetyl-CoA C-acetyltransferase [Chloroflexota bacterium]